MTNEQREKRNVYWRRYYAANREKLRKYNREWTRRRRAADHEGYLEYQRKYRAANREKLNEYMRQRRAADPEKYRKYEREHSRKYRAANRETVRAYNRAYFRRHRAEERELIKKARTAGLSPETQQRIMYAAAGKRVGRNKYQISRRLLYPGHVDAYSKGKHFLRDFSDPIESKRRTLTFSEADAIVRKLEKGTVVVWMAWDGSLSSPRAHACK